MSLFCAFSARLHKPPSVCLKSRHDSQLFRHCTISGFLCSFFSAQRDGRLAFLLRILIIVYRRENGLHVYGAHDLGLHFSLNKRLYSDLLTHRQKTKKFCFNCEIILLNVLTTPLLYYIPSATPEKVAEENEELKYQKEWASCNDIDLPTYGVARTYIHQGRLQNTRQTHTKCLIPGNS